MIIPIKHTNNKGTYNCVSTYMLFIKHIQTYTIIVVTPGESGRRDGED